MGTLNPLPKCDHCQKQCKSKACLLRHIRIHTRQHSFQCSYCDKSFTEAGRLTMHIRIHTGERPFQCSFCGKCFSAKQNLARHNRLHHDAFVHDGRQVKPGDEKNGGSYALPRVPVSLTNGYVGSRMDIEGKPYVFEIKIEDTNDA